jgi:hypothetical protein
VTAIASKTTLVAPIRLARPRLGAAGADADEARGAAGAGDGLRDFFLRLKRRANGREPAESKRTWTGVPGVRRRPG